jgi:3-keto-5-aminohexanoate cleavage enzyme
VWQNELDIYEMNKLVITVCPTGGRKRQGTNLPIPLRPADIAQSAFECYKAGASIVHIHARDENGNNTSDLRAFSEIINRIRDKCDILIQVGTGLGKKTPSSNFSLEERMALSELSPAPDMFTINGGTFDLEDVLFQNPFTWNESFLKKINSRGIPVECEIYDIGHIANMCRLRDLGLLKEPLHFNLLLGIDGGIPATLPNLHHLIDSLPESCTWQVGCVSSNSIAMITAAILLGGNIRTGLEDTIYFASGILAESNFQLVDRVVKIASLLNRDIADVEETKKILKLSNS